MAKANVTIIVAFNDAHPGAWLGIYPGDRETAEELRRPDVNLHEIDAKPIWGVEMTLDEAEYVGEKLLLGIQKFKAERGQAGHA